MPPFLRVCVTFLKIFVNETSHFWRSPTVRSDTSGKRNVKILRITIWSNRWKNWNIFPHRTRTRYIFYTRFRVCLLYNSHSVWVWIWKICFQTAMFKFAQLCQQLADCVIEVGDLTIRDAEKSKDPNDGLNAAKLKASKVRIWSLNLQLFLKRKTDSFDLMYENLYVQTDMYLQTVNSWECLWLFILPLSLIRFKMMFCPCWLSFRPRRRWPGSNRLCS